MPISFTRTFAKPAMPIGKVSGHDFSRAERALKLERALAPVVISRWEGTGFSPYIFPHKREGALAPAGKEGAR